MARITSYLPQLVGIRSAGAHLIDGYEGTLLARFEFGHEMKMGRSDTSTNSCGHSSARGQSPK
ncbi:hypothetical protein COLO4_28183 [Corchorus olitorius]|uniref:Uncharacterized protein n=1 Tax=Corchorus olitorius TaxID=93759 RepID=A0A1R3HMG9_9ROSI|nr:hypothetical protein COLO4_28183 [Corchorus olitorius]